MKSCVRLHRREMKQLVIEEKEEQIMKIAYFS
jgi:hypothetical protein